MKAKPAKLIRTLLLFACSVLLLALLADRCTVEVPTTERLADFAGGDLDIELRPELHPPYHLLVGVPGTSAAPPTFRGIIEIRSPDGSQHSVPISSDTATHANWIRQPSTSGFILAWSEPQRLSDILRRGVTYRVRLSFTEPVPAGCSLWFASMRHVSIITQRSA